MLTCEKYIKLERERKPMIFSSNEIDNLDKFLIIIR